MILTDAQADLLAYIKKDKESLIRDWESSIVISKEDPYKEKIRDNGVALFNIILNMHKMSQQEVLDLIQKLANEISDERVSANINIGDFVYNVNLGKTVLYNYVNKTGIPGSDLQETIDRINYCFDKFLYFAVTAYTEAKNKIIEEKSMFIDSTHQDRLTLLGQMTSSFIHEFRNPLTSIQGFIQLLKADYPDMKYLDIISNELEQLNFRISQFLLLSKKEIIGKEKEFFNLTKLIDEVLNFLYPSILDGKVKMLKELVDDITLFGYADEIRQVFINIIFNAIDILNHHRHPHPIVQIKSNMKDQTHIQIKVYNNGPMIPSELQNIIFEPFFTTKKLGTGLGLFVCKEIIEKHKGDLDFHSTPEITVFTITLPISAPPIQNDLSHI